MTNPAQDREMETLADEIATITGFAGWHVAARAVLNSGWLTDHNAAIRRAEREEIAQEIEALADEAQRQARADPNAAAARRKRAGCRTLREAAQVARGGGETEEHPPYRPWRPGDGDTRCQDCGHEYHPWFTDNRLWNAVMGGEDCADDPGGYLCPRCFADRAHSRNPRIIWRFVPERSGDSQ